MNVVKSGSGRFVLDIPNRQLLQDGEPVRLRRKTLEVLAQLAFNPGRLLTKEELLDAVWPQKYVSETVLKVCICELRKALKARHGLALTIETVYGYGYRLPSQLIVVRRSYSC